MIDVFNYRHYTHHLGSDYYGEIIRREVPPEHLVGKLYTASFKLSDYYPVVVRPNKASVHYNTYSSSRKDGTLREKFFIGYDREIRNAFDVGLEYLVFIDDELVATDRYLYMEQWCAQPISMYAKPSQFKYLTISFPHKKGVVFYFYPLRTELGARFLELYHGRYFSNEGCFSELGINIISNILRLTYASGCIGVKGLKECFVGIPPEDMGLYQIAKFMKREGNNL